MLIVVIVRRNAEQAVSLAQHLIIALRIKAVQTIMFTAIIIDFHSPEASQIFVIIIILQRPVGVVVTGKKAVFFHFPNIFINIICIVVSALWL